MRYVIGQENSKTKTITILDRSECLADLFEMKGKNKNSVKRFHEQGETKLLDDMKDKKQ